MMGNEDQTIADLTKNGRTSELYPQQCHTERTKEVNQKNVQPPIIIFSLGHNRYPSGLHTKQHRTKHYDTCFLLSWRYQFGADVQRNTLKTESLKRFMFIMAIYHRSIEPKAFSITKCPNVLLQQLLMLARSIHNI